jgi:hypothetical protein
MNATGSRARGSRVRMCHANVDRFVRRGFATVRSGNQCMKRADVAPSVAISGRCNARSVSKLLIFGSMGVISPNNIPSSPALVPISARSASLTPMNTPTPNHLGHHGPFNIVNSLLSGS